MALGFNSNGKKSDKKSDNNSSPSESHEMNNFGQGNYFNPDAEAQTSRRKVGARIDKPRTGSIVAGAPGTDVEGQDISVGQQMELEADNAIQYRTCSWQKTAALLFSEYICLAIMSFPYSYSVLGLVPGILLTLIQAGFVLYTSIVVWEFCIRHPEVKDVCDVGQVLLWGKKWAWWFTGVMFILNNTFIMGFHCLVGAKYLNTMTNHGICTIGFSAIMAVVSWCCSMPRTFSALAKLATVSAFFTFVSVLLACIFAGIEAHPGGATAETAWRPGGVPEILIIPAATTSFVDGMNAFLNISYTFIGQITLPSFIAEMKEPQDFPKALWAVTIAEVIVFSLVGGVIYGFTGTNYNVAPAFGSLGNVLYLKISFSFMIPTLIFLGVLYASVSARFLFFRLFRGTKHLGNHTVVGWAGWAGILAGLWVFAFIIAEVIPFFPYLLSLMSALFDSFFGWIYWGIAYWRMRKADYGPQFWKNRGIRGYVGFATNIFIIIFGFFNLVAGTYASVDAIAVAYEQGGFGGPFSCTTNGLYLWAPLSAQAAKL